MDTENAEGMSRRGSMIRRAEQRRARCFFYLHLAPGSTWWEGLTKDVAVPLMPSCTEEEPGAWGQGAMPGNPFGVVWRG